MQSEYTCKDKDSLRKYLKELRANIDDRAQKERAAIDNVLPLLHGNVLIYVSIGSELSTKRLIEELKHRDGVNLYVPLTEGNTITPVRLTKPAMVADKLGNIAKDCYIRESEKVSFDFCVTPLLGYNRSGHRIGYGKGCYDRFFSGDGDNCKKIGLAFGCQKCEFVADKHDVALDMCVTENGVEVFS